MTTRAYPRALKVLAGVGFLPCLYAFVLLPNDRTKYSIVVSALVSLLGFYATKLLIPVLMPVHLRRNLFGMDINKKGIFLSSSNRSSCFTGTDQYIP